MDFDLDELDELSLHLKTQDELIEEQIREVAQTIVSIEPTVIIGGSFALKYYYKLISRTVKDLDIIMDDRDKYELLIEKLDSDYEKGRVSSLVAPNILKIKTFRISDIMVDVILIFDKIPFIVNKYDTRVASLVNILDAKQDMIDHNEHIMDIKEINTKLINMFGDGR